MNNKYIENEKKYIMQTYKRQPMAFARGAGQYLRDENGRKYLDLFAGLSVCNLGHCHPGVTRAVRAQLGRLLHVSNVFYSPLQIELARIIIGRSFGKGSVFFSNSGAEANECAVKLARKWGKAHGKHEIITFKNSFHGRTIATLAATGQRKFRKGFEPLVPGFKYAVFNDLASVAKLAGPKTCAILLEPVQGEGGVFPADREFLLGLRKLCDRKNILLMYDEIQCGMGRTGELFAYQHYRVAPDVLTLAKSIANGLPLGATVVSARYASVLGAGEHGSTFGGNMLSCAAGIAVFKAMDSALLAGVRAAGNYFMKKLLLLKEKYPFIREVRGTGLMLGMELDFAGKDIVKQCLERGIVLNCTQDTVLRFLPPFTVTRGDIDRAIAVLDEIFKNH